MVLSESRPHHKRSHLSLKQMTALWFCLPELQMHLRNPKPWFWIQSLQSLASPWCNHHTPEIPYLWHPYGKNAHIYKQRYKSLVLQENLISNSGWEFDHMLWSALVSHFYSSKTLFQTPSSRTSINTSGGNSNWRFCMDCLGLNTKHPSDRLMWRATVDSLWRTWEMISPIVGFLHQIQGISEPLAYGLTRWSGDHLASCFPSSQLFSDPEEIVSEGNVFLSSVQWPCSHRASSSHQASS